ncbi:thioesterase family protein [Lipingzhangella sp. LS1_29]|uniref:Thioesterase family protein n=1 Tax=Lipingzhangella rawalii TaxID=2055835 RepID=A0ABU2H8C5_9ACTN|nr:thioesterase family protein [Lipingzhangella rawalii]MDS1271085.1 thioesterase family protein [Lipingzhangella rawalii]
MPRLASRPNRARLPQGAEPKRHVHYAQVRYADIDQQHHVNNVRMLTYLEDARISLLRWNDTEASTFGDVVVARQEADYLAPLLMRAHPLRVETWVTEVRRASFTLAYEIRDGDDTDHSGPVYLRARTVLAGFDSTTQRSRRLSEPEREFLHSYLTTE